MKDIRMDPDEILKEINKNDDAKQKGHLKIFFGYAAGVGKTYTMLEAAHDAKNRGIDVVVGYVEPHERPKTAALLEGLELIGTKIVKDNQIQLNEFDLDAVLKRKPELVLIDELAHTNAKTCRHSKRYQDVEELLKAGIHVYSTVNVQHIESLNDIVASITGVFVRERIPDKVFDQADQVELVDIEPQDLIERLNVGNVYKEEHAKKAVENFFRMDNLTALREIALRRCADRVNKLSETARMKNNSDYYTDEHILICLSSSPSNPKIIRTAARMANAFNGKFTALFVETPDYKEMSEENQNRLRKNMLLAEQLGAGIETIYGDDAAFQIAEFARLSGVSKIVVGRNNIRRRHLFSQTTLTEKLIEQAPNIDIYVIPDKSGQTYKVNKRKRKKSPFVLEDLIKSILILTCTTLIGVAFNQLGFSEANIITVEILGVLIIAIVTTQRIYSMIFSLISVLNFNFFFIEPRFSFAALDKGYPITFVIMFIAAFLSGSLAAKIKQNAKNSAQTAFRTKVLFDTNQLLQKASNRDQIVAVTAQQLIKLLDRNIIFYLVENETITEPSLFLCAEEGQDKSKNYKTENEKAVAIWVWQNNKRAGKTTNTLSNASCLYLAVRLNNKVYGVVGIALEELVLDAFENSIVLSILGECALAMENEKVSKEKAEAAVFAKNEQLRANLLRSISHDLRTPLTTISGNAGILLSKEEVLGKEKKKQLYNDIYDDSLWLINLVENLLAVTRIEDGTMNLRMSAELMDEVITEALHHVNRDSKEHSIFVHQKEEFMMARMDARLIVQVMINMIDNAIRYTQKGSTIQIITQKKDKNIMVEIKDDGPGIPEEEKACIFDMFYTGANQIADSRRSMGLGLALCKSIINAHGGEITVTDNKPHGTVFCFTLPAKEVKLHE